jgi:hypothetical protein
LHHPCKNSDPLVHARRAPESAQKTPVGFSKKGPFKGLSGKRVVDFNDETRAPVNRSGNVPEEEAKITGISWPNHEENRTVG